MIDFASLYVLLVLQLVKSLPCQIVLFTWTVHVSPRKYTQIHTPTVVQGVSGGGGG